MLKKIKGPAEKAWSKHPIKRPKEPKNRKMKRGSVIISQIVTLNCALKRQMDPKTTHIHIQNQTFLPQAPQIDRRITELIDLS
jgi:hypothetical protein